MSERAGLTGRNWARCRCRCHSHPGSVKHVAACCCPHRFKVRRECPTCNPKEEERADA